MKITMKHLAKDLGLAVSTVSRALSGSYGVNPKTMERVQQRARELRYVPDLGAKQLVGKGSGLIGVFIPEFDYFDANPDFQEFYPPLRKTLQTFGKDVIVFSVPFENVPPNRLHEYVAGRNLEGCIIMPAFHKEHPVMKEALKLKIPSVNFGGAIGPRCSLVQSDDKEGGKMAARLLLSLGHRVIGFVSGPKGLRICQERYEGLTEMMAESGLEHAEQLVALGNFSGDSGSKAALDLLARNPDMTAVFCANDLMAMGVISALVQKGVRIPEDISVIGYDGAFYTAHANPPLTTIRHANERISIRAVEMMMELLNGGTSRSEMVAPTMMERKSTGPAAPRSFYGEAPAQPRY